MMLELLKVAFSRNARHIHAIRNSTRAQRNYAWCAQACNAEKLLDFITIDNSAHSIKGGKLRFPEFSSIGFGWREATF